ncbi:uncharacterized protein RJT20DRAFT_146719 [Scheffersomyces xylosifermentans]|uniref:uncharacterized protein n=1 Tax=Scheffersomyces xylosifermentans TaxID=1304137 RepID=UPI00315DACFF
MKFQVPIHMFDVELDINTRIAESKFAGNFPKLLASGIWNAAFDKPVLILEYLGEELPEKGWDRHQVRRVIRSRLKELHSLGISHNDIRIPNIHVSRSGKISLIDFGLSDRSNDESHKERDFEILDRILGFEGDSDNAYDE